MNLSIIIPTFNESAKIAKLITNLLSNCEEALAEIIISDGDSTDDTVAQAKNAGAIAVTSPEKGRGNQMNYGASFANGDILYFIHADSCPPASFAQDIEIAVQNGYGLGRYRTQFDSSKWYLKLNSFFTRFDLFMCYGGDQTLFVSRELFNKIGGFCKDMQIMEEFDFVNRARKNGKYKIFGKAALISARKYDSNSWLRVQLANSKMVRMYKKGANQQDMIDTYKRMLHYRKNSF